MRAKDSKKSTISLLIIIAVVIAVMFIINVICKYNFLTVNNWMLIIAGAVIPTFTAWGLCFLFAANVTDFSIGAMVILGANLAGTWGNSVGIPGVLVGGLLIGICLTMANFLVFNLSKIPSWIAGMGMTLIYESIGVVYSNKRLAEENRSFSLKMNLEFLVCHHGSISFLLLAESWLTFYIIRLLLESISVRSETIRMWQNRWESRL